MQLKAVKSLVVLAFTFLLFSERASADCAEILKQGIFNVVKINDREDFSYTYTEWLKTVDENEAKSATSLGLDISLPLVGGGLVPLGLDFSNDDWNKWKKVRDSGQYLQINRTQLINRFSRTVDKNLVAAWLECTRARAKAQGLSSELNHKNKETEVTITVDWRVPGADVGSVTFYEPYLRNLKLVKPPKSMTISNNGYATFVFDIQNKKESSTIIIDSDRLPIIYNIPAEDEGDNRPFLATKFDFRLVTGDVKGDDGEGTDGDFSFTFSVPGTSFTVSLPGKTGIDETETGDTDDWVGLPFKGAPIDAKKIVGVTLNLTPNGKGPAWYGERVVITARNAEGAAMEIVDQKPAWIGHGGNGWNLGLTVKPSRK